ncbi:hypothetical protein [Psychrobacter sp. UBA3480]|uniref:hypothetical protein n=1 Tax=Psychrobacter sp. UBA3480 TaxID=1947350 RepID=UPI0025E25357|nr:hypothetical protein [Psychrobacter sp. UBA3480]
MATKAKTAKQLNAVIDEQVELISNYSQHIKKMNKEMFSYYLYHYMEEMNIPPLSLAFIFNDRFGTEVTDYREIVSYSKSYDAQVNGDSNDKEVYAAIPVVFYIYMENFWREAMLKLKSEWQVDNLDLAVMLVESQIANGYANGWAYHLISAFCKGSMEPKEIKTIMSDARSIVEDGDSVKQPKEFHWLLAINMGSFLNTKRMSNMLNQKVFNAYEGLYDVHKSSANKKIKKGIKELDSNKNKEDVISIVFTANELKALQATSAFEYATENSKATIDKIGG